MDQMAAANIALDVVSIILSLLPVVYLPVSYTHLDVYKRQAIACAAENARRNGLSNVVEYKACLLYTSRCV